MVRPQFVIEAKPAHFVTPYGLTMEVTQALRFASESDAQAWIEQWPWIDTETARVRPVEIKEESGRFAGLQSNYNPFGT